MTMWISRRETTSHMCAQRDTARFCRSLKARRFRRNGSDEDREADEISKPTRTHWDMLLERRTEDELKTLLEKRLQMHRDGWFPDYE